VEIVMYLRCRVEGLNEAFCPVCERWLLLAYFEPITGSDVLSEVCSACREQVGNVAAV
jgi:hypothetical protein